MITDNAKRPLYFVNVSSGLVPSNPNSLRDMGRVGFCEYKLNTDATDQALDRNVHWSDLLQDDIKKSRDGTKKKES